MRLATLLILITILASVAPLSLAHAQGVTVSLDRSYYDRGDIVNITVSCSSATNVGIEVRSPSGGVVWIDESTCSPPSITLRFRIPSSAPEGTYKVYAATPGSSPIVKEFVVKRPTFRIVSVSPSKLSMLPGASTYIAINVTNEGAKGDVAVRVRLGGSVLDSKTVTIAPNTYAAVYLKVTAPANSGSYTLTVEAYNVKYATVDDSRSVALSVVAPVTTTVTPTTPPPPPPPPAPPVPAVTPTTTIMPTTVATPPPRIEKMFEADISRFVSASGIALQTITVRVPEIGVSITIPSGTSLMVAGRPVTKITIGLVATPPTAPATQVYVGPVLELGPSGARFSQPIRIEVPYDPGKVPSGYVVRLAYYDELRGMWIPVTTLYVDPFRRVVVGETTHFTMFAPIAFRIATPVTTPIVTVTTPLRTTTTTTVVQTVTKPFTKTTVVITATPVTTTTTVATTRTMTVATTRTRPVTATKTVEVTKTAVRTAIRTERTTVVRTVTAVATTPITTTVEVTPPWVLPVVAALAIVAVVAAALAAYFYAKSRRGAGPQTG